MFPGSWTTHSGDYPVTDPAERLVTVNSLPARERCAIFDQAAAAADRDAADASPRNLRSVVREMKWRRMLTVLQVAA